MPPSSGIWIYFLGEAKGGRVKIGKTADETVASRLRTVNTDQWGADEYRLLAACRGTPKDEQCLLRHFAHLRDETTGSRTEYFHADKELIGYISWLRRQWWTSISERDTQTDWAVEDASHWLPGDGRYDDPPIVDPGKLIQDHEQLDGPLAGTAWSWMPAPQASVQDYFTPVEIVDAVRVGMGGIDLDAASHWLANYRHRIPQYFDINKSAFDHDWFGNVWLNPPYGNNAPWFSRAVEFLDSGAVKQLAILSPAWAFTTQIARPLMARASATILLVPTPKFWGNKDPGKTGTNNPHCIVYVGDRRREFFAALHPFGIPFTAAWNELPELRDDGVRLERAA